MKKSIVLLSGLLAVCCGLSASEGSQDERPSVREQIRAKQENARIEYERSQQMGEYAPYQFGYMAKWVQFGAVGKCMDEAGVDSKFVKDLCVLKVTPEVTSIGNMARKQYMKDKVNHYETLRAIDKEIKQSLQQAVKEAERELKEIK